LSRLAKALDSLEKQNQELREQLAQVVTLRAHSRLVSNDLPYVNEVPVPPSILRFWVAGTEDIQWFINSGQLGMQTIIDVLRKHNIALSQFESILDFGCGCGRVIRYLSSYSAIKIYGTDCNEDAIRWCDENLDFAVFSSNLLAPPTRYRDHSFDLIYAFSVFTHLTEELQIRWIQELHRILKPNGYLIITLHGDFYLSHIPETERESYKKGELIVTGTDKVSLNTCMAFHPESYVRNILVGELFEVIGFYPQGALGNPKQDVYLLKSCGRLHKTS
jgi:SAM-dependent methyltransferase